MVGWRFEDKEHAAAAMKICTFEKDYKRLKEHIHDGRGWGLICLGEGNTAPALDRVRSEYVTGLWMRKVSTDKEIDIDRFGNVHDVDKGTDFLRWTSENALSVIDGKRYWRRSLFDEPWFCLLMLTNMVNGALVALVLCYPN